MTSPLDTIVYLIEDGKIVETSIRDCSGYIDITTTPLGVAPRYHTRDNELWTWGVQGNFPKKVKEFATEEEAQTALEETFVIDFWECVDICAYKFREQAEKVLAESEEE